MIILPDIKTGCVHNIFIEGSFIYVSEGLFFSEMALVCDSLVPVQQNS